MKVLLAVLAGSLFFVVVSPAAAKELREVKICGPSACSSITDQATMQLIAAGDGSRSSAAAVGQYYTVTFTVDAGNKTDSWQVFYVPDAGMVRAAGEFNAVEWSRVPAATRAAYAGVAAGLQPFDVPHLSAVRVGVRGVAANPDSYLGLYSVGRRFYGAVQGARWIRITLRSLVPSPWTDGLSVLSYSPNRRLLRRDGATFRISKRLCDQLSRGAALA